jgi:hypothetical protein
VQEARQELEAYLRTAETEALSVYGEHFRDPAQVALYADEITELIGSLVQLLDEFAGE